MNRCRRNLFEILEYLIGDVLKIRFAIEVLHIGDRKMQFIFRSKILIVEIIRHLVRDVKVKTKTSFIGPTTRYIP